MLTWQDVAGGLPQPDVPVPFNGWGTRLFSSVLLLEGPEERRALQRALRKMRENGNLLILRDCDGNSLPCRLLDLEGGRRVVFEFEVVDLHEGVGRTPG